MNSATGALATRVAARTVVAALLLAMTMQYLALSPQERDDLWPTGSLCARSTAPSR